MLERSSLGVTVGIALGHVKVEDLASLDLLGGDLDRKLTQKFGHHMPPRLLPQVKVGRLDCLLRGLVAGETGPLV